MSNAHQNIKKSKETSTFTNNNVTTSNNKLVNTETYIHLKSLLKLRDRTFQEEYNRLDFTYSTTIDYKSSNSFKPYKLLLSGRKLYIIKISKHNKKNSSLSQHSTIKKSYYYNSYDLGYPEVSLNFDLVTAKLLIDKNKSIITIMILGNDKKFDIRVKDNKEVFNRLAFLLNQIIISSDGYASNLFCVSLRCKDFYKNNYISNSEFISKAKTGDLLIFRGLECPAPLQRFFTGDEYDHVALVKRKDGCVYIYEATTIQKCNLLSWNLFNLSLYNLIYDKIVYRRLLYDSTDKDKLRQIQNDLEKKSNEYIEETKKKDYALSVGAVICWGQPREFEQKNEWKKSKGFSCSSLLTGAYYKMGVLEITHDTRSILPSHYSQRDNTTLKMSPGFSFGPEEIIEFSK